MELITKLIEAKRTFVPVKKDAVNPHFKNKYMTLDDIVDSITISLHKQGLLMYHAQTEAGLKTIITDGKDSIESFYPIRSGLTDQQLGSALTYGRRYSICCLLSIVADEDDDGNKASQPTPPTPKVDPLANLLDKLKNATNLDQVNELETRWQLKKEQFTRDGFFLAGIEAIDKRTEELKK